MNLDQQIEFYRQQYQTAKTKAMALVAFGAYAALVLLRADRAALDKDARQ
jgi:hypothetical protein